MALMIELTAVLQVQLAVTENQTKTGKQQQQGDYPVAPEHG